MMADEGSVSDCVFTVVDIVRGTSVCDMVSLVSDGVSCCFAA